MWQFVLQCWSSHAETKQIVLFILDTSIKSNSYSLYCGSYHTGPFPSHHLPFPSASSEDAQDETTDDNRLVRSSCFVRSTSFTNRLLSVSALTIPSFYYSSWNRLINSMNLIVAQLVKKSSHFIEPKDFLVWLQESATSPYSESI
jgi:hypothetical protein